MTDLYIILGVLAVVIAGLFVVPFLKKKNVINDSTFDNIDDTLKFARLVFDVIQSDKIDNTKTNFIFDVADQVVEHVNKLYVADGDKTAISLEITDSILKQMGVKPSKSEIELIKIIVSQGIKYAEKVNK